MEILLNVVLRSHNWVDDIGHVMISVLYLSVVDREFECWSCQIKDYEMGSCCFSTKNAVLRSKSTDWFAQNQDNVSEWSDMYTHTLLFQWARTIKIQ